MKNRRRSTIETQYPNAPAAVGQDDFETQVDSADSATDGQVVGVTHETNAVVHEARGHHSSETQEAGAAGLSQSGRHLANDTHCRAAAGDGARDHRTVETHLHSVAGLSSSQSGRPQPRAAAGDEARDQAMRDPHFAAVAGLVISIRAAHRRRRYAMKVQQKIDRAQEAYFRINHTNWRGDMDEKAREAIRKQVAAIIKAARNDEGDPDLVELVKGTDLSRGPYDNLRQKTEKAMEAAAKQLPVYPWIENVRGAGALGLATIVAEVAAIKPSGEFATFSDYSSPAKVWKRLGFAPYDGHAGSTWKRTTWRPRALSADEWISNPFSGERYALMIQIATWLINAQWQSAKKAGGDTGKPTGPYGQIYADRRTHTAQTHPDWTKGHSHSDAVRVTMKTFLKDLWEQWKGTTTGRENDGGKKNCK